jgi:hypothetical protein
MMKLFKKKKSNDDFWRMNQQEILNHVNLLSAKIKGIEHQLEFQPQQLRIFQGDIALIERDLKNTITLQNELRLKMGSIEVARHEATQLWERVKRLEGKSAPKPKPKKPTKRKEAKK